MAKSKGITIPSWVFNIILVWLIGIYIYTQSSFVSFLLGVYFVFGILMYFFVIAVVTKYFKNPKLTPEKIGKYKITKTILSKLFSIGVFSTLIYFKFNFINIMLYVTIMLLDVVMLEKSLSLRKMWIKNGAVAE